MINKDHVQAIGRYIIDGMSDKEACILAEVPYSEFTELLEINEDIREYFEKKRVKFKHNHLQEIQSRKSDKSSQWLLEKLRPDEFGPKTKANTQPTINIISQFISDIQNENAPIIDIEVGKARKKNQKILKGGKQGGQGISEILN